MLWRARTMLRIEWEVRVAMTFEEARAMGSEAAELARLRSTGRWMPLLRELAAFDAWPEPMVSLYLNVCWDDEQQRERTRLEIKDQLRRARGAGWARPADLVRVDELVEERVRRRGPPEDELEGGSEVRGVRGEAFFLCAERGFERHSRSGALFPNRLYVASSPSLRPLAAAHHARSRALCVTLDAVSTRIYDVDPDRDRSPEAERSAGGLLAVVEGVVPKRQSQGGWSQLKLQHYREHQVDQHHDEAARLVARYFAESVPRRRVLLGGRAEAVANFERHLPVAVRAEVLRVPELASAESEAALLAACSQALREAEHEEATALLSLVEGAASPGFGGYAGGDGGRGAIGVAATVAALNGRRVDELLLAEGLCCDGWRCVRCEAMGSGQDHASCTSCGGPVAATELGEAMVRAAIAQDALLHTLPSPSRLDALGGVAARLRF